MCPRPPQRGCSRACTRAAVLQSSSRAAPVAPHPRAWVSAPSASRCSSAGAGGISATPHPLRTLSLLGVSAAASETRRRLCGPRCPAPLRRSPGGLTSALGPALTWFCAGWGFGYGSWEVRSPPTASRKVHGRAFPRLQHPPRNLSPTGILQGSFFDRTACFALSHSFWALPLAHINAHLYTHLIAARPGPEFSSPTPRSNTPTVADNNVRGWHLRAR